MDEQKSPVADDEVVLRRVHRSFFDLNDPFPIKPVAFRPNKQDTTGLSVFRERFVQPVDTLVGIPDDKQEDYVVVRIAVSDLKRLGLSVFSEPDPDGPAGHAVIPELSWDSYQADKNRLKEIQVELALLAGRSIAHRS